MEYIVDFRRDEYRSQFYYCIASFVPQSCGRWNDYFRSIIQDIGEEKVLLLLDRSTRPGMDQTVEIIDSQTKCKEIVVELLSILFTLPQLGYEKDSVTFSFGDPNPFAVVKEIDRFIDERLQEKAANSESSSPVGKTPTL